MEREACSKRDVECPRKHYTLTFMHWNRNLKRNDKTRNPLRLAEKSAKPGGIIWPPTFIYLFILNHRIDL